MEAMDVEEIAELVWELHKHDIVTEIAARALESTDIEQALRSALSGSVAASIAEALAEASEEYLVLYDLEDN